LNLHICKKKKRKGFEMKNGLALAAASLVWASSAMAHPGAHVHPHDGAHWLALISALGLIAVAGGLACAKTRARP
jgi:zinc transporter ZupT